MRDDCISGGQSKVFELRNEKPRSGKSQRRSSMSLRNGRSYWVVASGRPTECSAETSRARQLGEMSPDAIASTGGADFRRGFVAAGLLSGLDSPKNAAIQWL